MGLTDSEQSLTPATSTNAASIAAAAPASDGCEFAADPEAALAAVACHRGTVIVDLDETLYLRNSTEDFIDCASPGLIAVLLLRTLDVLKPWRISGGEVTRDVWRVNLIRWLFPWTSVVWRRRCARLAQTFANAPLLNAVKAHGDAVYVVTVGFGFIVAPLVAAMGLSPAGIIACAPRFAHRRAGKLAMAQQALGDAALPGALLVTDSLQDLSLLRRCGVGLHTLWPDAAYRRALARVYVPGQYLSQVKRPGERYILRGILQEDFAFWVLSSVMLAPSPLVHVLGLLLLLGSFWAIYERGYVDNDLTGARHEEDPRLSAAFHEAPVATPRFLPWLWAAALGAAGCAVLDGMRPLPLHLVLWAALLLVLHAVFLIFNRLDKPTRVWLFPVLQFGRTAAFTTVVPISAAGAAGLAAHVIARWIPYYFYRHGTSKKWPESTIFPMRLMFFVVIALMLAIADGASMLTQPTTLMLLAWNLFRARHELHRGLRQIMA